METRIGVCRYCGESRMIEVRAGATEEELSQEAERVCGCDGAEQARERREQKEACIANIEEMLSKRYPEITGILIDSIDMLQDAIIKKITINTHHSQTIRLQRTKDGIKVELEKKTKEESLA